MPIESLTPQAYIRNAKIFIVDDALANLDILRLYLEQGGHEVAFANTGEKALQLIPRWQPQLILLDIMMTPMDGFTVCRHLKANELTAKIPIIFISALTSTEDLTRGFREGGVDYLTKPFSRPEILLKVQTQLERVWYRQRSLRLQYDLSHCFEYLLNPEQHPDKGVLRLDYQGNILDCNDAAQDILQLEPTTMPIAVHTWTRLFQQEEVHTLKQHWQNSGLAPHTYQTQLRVENRQQHLQFKIFPLLAEHQEHTLLFVLLTWA